MLSQALDKRLNFLPYKLQLILSKIGVKKPLRFFQAKDTSYETLLSDYVNKDGLKKEVYTEKYLKLFENASNLPALQTNIDIQHTLFGARQSQVTKEKGRPEFVYEENDIEIFIYRWKSHGVRIRYTIHFYKNRVFFINCNFIAPNAAQKKIIIDSIAQKYGVDNLPGKELTKHVTRDNNDNMIFIDDNVWGIKVNYLNNKNADWFKGMSNEIYVELKKQRSIEIAQEKWLNATI
jgi:hypothetical protein